MKTEVLVQGYYGRGNLGDDALMVACFNLLRRLYPVEAITFRAQPAAYLQRLIPGSHVVEFEAQLDSVDLQVHGGGTQYFLFPRPVQRASLAARVRAKLTALTRPASPGQPEQAEPLITRRAALGIGLGPFAHEWYQQDTKQLFQQFGYIAVRDPVSLDTCRGWGLNHAVLRSDLCFLPGLWDNITQAEWTSPQQPFHLGVIGRDWPHSVAGAAYRAPLRRVVAALRRAGFQVTYVLFQPGEAWAVKLAQRGDIIEVWDPHHDTIPQFLNRLTRFDALLTARYHGAVFGALLGKPVICIEVEPKLRLAAELLADGHLWRQPFRPEEVLAHVNDIVCHYEQAQTFLRQALSVQRQLAAEMQREFCHFVRV